MIKFLRGEEEFVRLGMKFGLVPVVAETPAARRSASEIFRALKEGGFAFLAEGDGRDVHEGRYSVIGLSPLRTFSMESDADDRGGSFLRVMRGYVEGAEAFRDPMLPPFSGGLFGYFGFEAAAVFEGMPCDFGLKKPLEAASFFAPGVVAVLDRVRDTLLIVCYAETRGKAEGELKEMYRVSYRRLVTLYRRLALHGAPSRPLRPRPLAPVVSREAFMERVSASIEAIKRGEAGQIVVSQRFEGEAPEDPIALYEALRRENPSPFHFYFESPGVTLIGASPEVLARVRNGRVELRPLAGTRRRGSTPAEDAALEAELKADPKEREEHILLVELAKEDAAKTCLPSSVAVTEYMEVERFARVMHIVSQVEGDLRPGMHALDAFRASFPAGTVSGAPRRRAMEIIAEVEGEPRNSYAGAFCALDYDGDLDSCIAIRTFSISAGRLHLQVGAGVVADSNPATEYKETMHKADALFRALAGGHKAAVCSENDVRAG